MVAEEAQVLGSILDALIATGWFVSSAQPFYLIIISTF